MADAAATAKEIKQMLLDAAPLSCEISKPLLPNCDRITSRAMLTSLGLKLGDRVVIAGQKVGEVTVVSEAMSEVAVWVARVPRLQTYRRGQNFEVFKKGQCVNRNILNENGETEMPAHCEV